MELYHVYLKNGVHFFVDVDEINYATAYDFVDDGCLKLWMKDGTIHEISGDYANHLPVKAERMLTDIMELKQREKIRHENI